MALGKINLPRHFETHLPAAKCSEASSDAFWVPNTDVYITAAGLVIKVEVAGIRREELELTAAGNRLKIKGCRPDGCRTGKCMFLVMEINYGAFESVIDIPSGYDLGQARAIYQNGFLRIDVPVTVGQPPSVRSVPICTEEI